VTTTASVTTAAPVTSHLPQRDNNNLADVTVTHPVKKVKLPNAAVVGTGFTGKYDAQLVMMNIADDCTI
jgi:hypothetical protein